LPGAEVLRSLIVCLPLSANAGRAAGKYCRERPPLAATSGRLATDATASACHAQLIVTGLGTYRV